MGQWPEGVGMKPLHHALREARVRSGLSQTEAADLSGIERGQICDLESPRCSGVHLKTLRVLADTYGFTVSELIGEERPSLPTMNAKERRAVGLLLAVMRGDA